MTVRFLSDEEKDEYEAKLRREDVERRRMEEVSERLLQRERAVESNVIAALAERMDDAVRELAGPIYSRLALVEKREARLAARCDEHEREIDKLKRKVRKLKRKVGRVG